MMDDHLPQKLNMLQEFGDDPGHKDGKAFLSSLNGLAVRQEFC